MKSRHDTQTQRVYCAVAAIVLIQLATGHAGQVKLTVGEPTGVTVSPHLIGMNAVYSHESTDSWQDGGKIKALKDAGVNTLRYPGGHVVSFWDWEFPYHNAYQNFWDPTYVKSLTPTKRAQLKKEHGNRMQLDDFFRICAEAGLEPVVGINMFQGYKFNRTEESVAKAVRLVKHCQKQSPRAKYYYLDNEAGHQPTQGKHVPVDDYLKLIPVYSKAIKKAQPDAKLIVNPIGWNSLGSVIKDAGAYFDLLDLHWYYSNRQWGRFYIEDWRKEREHEKLKRALSQLRKAQKETGYSHIQLASLEWNLGPATGEEGSDSSSALFAGLVQADMLTSFMSAGLAMAATWPMTWNSSKPGQGGYRNFLDQNTGEASPSKHIYRWFSQAGDGALLKTATAGGEGIRCAAVKSSKHTKTTLVYVINKSTEDRDITVTFPKDIASASVEAFEKGASVNDVRVRTVPAKMSGRSVTLRLPDTSVVFVTAVMR